MFDETYRIVKIIDENRVVVNAGQTNGISTKSLLEIFVPGENVIDPETGEDLGSLDYVKARLEVITVMPRMCVCVNNKIVTTELKTIMNAMEFGRTAKRESLNINSEEISGGYENIDKKIHVGDKVRKALG